MVVRDQNKPVPPTMVPQQPVSRLLGLVDPAYERGVVLYRTPKGRSIIVRFEGGDVVTYTWRTARARGGWRGFYMVQGQDSGGLTIERAS